MRNTPTIVVDNIEFTECLNGDCIIESNEWRQTIKMPGGYSSVKIHIPAKFRNAIAEFLKV
jgi:hypothetical protein